LELGCLAKDRKGGRTARRPAGRTRGVTGA
jgi:hypothetical protein